jgi:hypothetical protein
MWSGSFPNGASITRLIDGVLLRQNDEWQLQRRYMRLEAVSELLQLVADGRPARTSTKGCLTNDHLRPLP